MTSTIPLDASAAAQPTAPATLLLHLDGPLDGAAVDRIDAELARASSAVRAVRIDAAGATELEPVATARLWLICQRWERIQRRAIRITGLSPATRRRLRLHPLLGFVSGEEELFEDPFATFRPSER